MIGTCKIRSICGLLLCVASAVTFATGCRPEDHSSLFLRAQRELSQGNEQNGMTFLNEAIARKPDFGQALVERGSIYWDREQHEQAMKDFSMAIEFLPVEEAIHFRITRARLCRNIGGAKASIAKKDCDVFIKHHTEEDYFRALAFATRAWTHLVADRYGEAIQDSSAALSNPNANDQLKAEALTYRASAYMRLGNHESAIADCTDSIRIDPSHSISHLTYSTRGLAYLATGRQEEADADFATANRIREIR